MAKTNEKLSQEIVDLRQRLIESEIMRERYQAIVEIADHIIIGLQPDYTIFEWNKSAERLYGWTREEALDQNYLEQFIPEEVRQNVAQDIAKVLAGIPNHTNYN